MLQYIKVWLDARRLRLQVQRTALVELEAAIQNGQDQVYHSLVAIIKETK